MRIGANSIIVNELGKVLLIKRDDTRLLAPPGGALNAGELPTNGVIREVREETGLIVLPVRLVGVFFWPARPEGFLSLVFRCLIRGGQIQTSVESPHVGFFSTNPLPYNIFAIHRERVERGLTHQGGPPYWGRHKVTPAVRLGRFLLAAFVYPFKDLLRALRRQPRYQPPPEWQTGTFVVLRNEEGKVLWLKRRHHDAWHLPGGDGNSMEAPWETAVRQTHTATGLTVRLTGLTGVYVYEQQSHMVFTFTADSESGQLNTGPEAAEFAYFTPGEEPPNSAAQDVERVADACNPIEETIFRYQPGTKPWEPHESE